MTAEDREPGWALICLLTLVALVISLVLTPNPKHETKENPDAFGYLCGGVGVPASANPYRDSPDANQWLRGWVRRSVENKDAKEQAK